ncbi:class I SAM-dependent methyltransferase [Kitasatospora sp. NPDC059747]|uniref:class I SAM-dependent methyltransferase n=1 Tax=Kitasatospora sp. NPDC059747 TaxID=3346930 RepID=UPI003656B545
MIDGWTWDETLFAGTAAYYERGRLPYAPGLADALAGVLRLDGRGRLLDVGCGPGTLALLLAHRFEEVAGVDPDAGMIAAARRAAKAAEVAGRSTWLRIRAEQLPAGLGTFTVATFGQSFHWMDRDLVAATVRGMLRPGGALVHVSDLKPDLKPGAEFRDPRPAEGLPHPPVPDAAIGELVRRYLGPVRRAGRGLLAAGTPGNESAVLARAGFAGPERVVVPGGLVLERTVDDVVAGVFSMSFSAPHLFGPGRAAFEADLRRLLARASAAGRFSVRQPATEVFVWRPVGVP